ncbi:sensor histidine kinase [Paraflavitalea sp. CAU 1676]|uniref:tetratricopeptide repeat-containing sensor histidine kinase n=1 Tax=Paraflavitalea sp. CAU 1676 TaxID=3032598 RepID=UPI0023DA90EE|nr:sensor histidine kinase [Paraflavitalea sp. CAU 1676]MDF2191544.1 sensor histidine kinase [Paraflavitalea sp. CAU 1676]
MLKAITVVIFFIATIAPATAQLPAELSQHTLRNLLQESKPDSNRILLLQALGKSYLKDEFNDARALLIDTAIGLFNHATSLSDTLHLQHFWIESKLLEGDAYLLNSETAEGVTRFTEVAALYRAQGDLQMEAQTWLRLARNISYTGEYYTEIEGYFDRAIKLYTKTRNVEREAAARTSLADFLFAFNKFDLAEKELLRAIDLRHQTGNTKVSFNYLLLSQLNRYRAAYEKSLSYATKSVDNAMRNNDTAVIDLYYGELALVLDELGRSAESSYWYRKTLTKRIARNLDRLTLHKTAGLLIRQLINSNQSRDALALADSLITAKPPQTPLEKAIAMQNNAYCFDALKQYPKAEQYYNSMAAYFRKTALNDEYVFLGNLDIGRFYLERGQYKKAHNYLDAALAYGGARMVDQRELHHLLFSADSALGNYAAAIKNLQQYEVINDSIYNERKSRQIEELTIQYETEKKEQSIQLLEKEKRIQLADLAKEKNSRRWTLGVALLLIILVALLVNYARLKQRTNRKLQVQQLLIEKKNDTLQHLVEEKEWLVREIHHRVKNNFQTVMGLLRTQSAYLQGEEAKAAVTESQQRIQAMSLVHQKLYQSDNLSAINMADYIHELIDCLKDSFHTGNTIRYNLQIDPAKLNIAHCIPLGLILNEAITNAIKHAFPGGQGGVIDVLFKRTAQDHFTLSIKDNGSGLPDSFDPSRQSSMGMKLMRGLSGDLDATFQVNLNNGTEIRLDFISEA